MSKEFRITEPGFYRTRDGRKAEVEFVSRYDIEFPARGGIGGAAESWTMSGRYYSSEEDCYGDLVAKWEEPAEQLYEWAYQEHDGAWLFDYRPRTEQGAEAYREKMGTTTKRRLRRFPTEDCE